MDPPPASEITSLMRPPRPNIKSNNNNNNNNSHSSRLATSRRCIKRPVVVMITVALILLLPFVYYIVKKIDVSSSDRKKNVMNKQEMKMIQKSGGFVLAPDVVKSSSSTTTFGELAQLMVPAWYAETIKALPIFEPTVMPKDVFTTRKILLKTRDLMDVFSPVYTNSSSSSSSASTTTTKHNKKKKKKDDDMWYQIRKYLDEGYELVGHFQDLHNAHVRYTDTILEQARNKVLTWKYHFSKFERRHHVMMFLSEPTIHGSRGFRHHHESRLFWMNAPNVPSANDPVTGALQMLASIQLHRANKFLDLAFGDNVTLNETFHDHYHSLRKELRSLLDEFELFGDTLVPMTVDTKAALQVLIEARSILGHMNNDFEAYDIYVMNDIHHKEQQDRATKVHTAWKKFQQWKKDSNFDGAIQHLTTCMESSSNSSSSSVGITIVTTTFTSTRKQVSE